jgi:hypothetical protein
MSKVIENCEQFSQVFFLGFSFVNLQIYPNLGTAIHQLSKILALSHDFVATFSPSLRLLVDLSRFFKDREFRLDHPAV